MPTLAAHLAFLLLPQATEPPHVGGDEPKAAAAQDLTELSLEDLMNVEVEVVSASRHAQSLSSTPAAIFVLTNADLRRSGATSIPEALRLVPGVDVARLDSNRWAVTIRGFNDQFANKLLVLVDGRSVYTPLFSGVFWDTLDVPMADIERIEVVRGPGGALWGANAVNGIVNIITKSAAETQGTLAALTVGNEDRLIGYVRHGGKTATGSWRAWAKFTDRDATQSSSGGEGEDDWNQLHLGARQDFAPSERDAWTLSGEAYRGEIHNQFDVSQPTPPFLFSQRVRTEAMGAGLRARWTRTLGEKSNFSLQAFLDHYSRELELFEEQRTTADVDFQHTFPLSSTQQLMWGASARASYTDTTDTFLLAWRDNHRTDTLASAFVQDEITLVPDRWKLTVGTKLEHSDASGADLQPSVRLLFTPNERETWWASVSRAVRTPSQAEQDVTVLQGFVPGAPNQVFLAQGDSAVDSETMDALELGWRIRPSGRISIDVAAFYDHYSDLIQYEPGTPFVSGADLIIPLIAENRPSADAYGAEVAAEWAPSEDTRLSGSWSLLQITVDSKGSTSPTVNDNEGLTPENQYNLRVQHDLPNDLQADAMLFYVDRLPASSIDHYWRLDLRLEWRPDDRRSFAIGVQNLFHEGEQEFGTATFNTSNEMESAIYLRALWSF